MFWILLLGCLFASIGGGEPEPLELVEIAGFFNNLFNLMFGFGVRPNFYIEGNLEGLTEFDGKVKVRLYGPVGYIDNGIISYPDNNTKLCSMELVIKDGITIDSIENNVLRLKLSQCHILLQFSVTNTTGVTIKPETVVAFGCNVKEADGTPSPWGPQVTQGLSNLLKERAEKYLTKHFDSTDSFSYDYFKNMNATNAELQDIMDTILIFS